MLEECKKFNKPESIGLEPEDIWIQSRLTKLISEVTESMDKMRLREALHHVLYEFDSELQWFLKRVNAKKREDVSGIMHKILSIRVAMLSPFAPHIAEEMWENLGNTQMASKSTWPTPEIQDNSNTILTENLLSSTTVSYTHLTLPTKA